VSGQAVLILAGVAFWVMWCFQRKDERMQALYDEIKELREEKEEREWPG
jgi:hypothetical protein